MRESRRNKWLVGTLLLSVTLNVALLVPRNEDWLLELSRALDRAAGPATPQDPSAVFHLFQERVQRLSPVASSTEAAELGDDLVIRPGRYRIGSRTYDFARQGLYRVIQANGKNRQRIVFEDDVDALLSAIAWISSHGNVHEGLPSEELNDRSRHSKLFLTCGTLSMWAKDLLEAQGLRARVVTSLTLDVWNSYDNGHTLIEVDREGRWVVYDLDNNFSFHSRGRPLSLFELSERVASGDYTLSRLARDVRLDISNFKNAENGYDYGFFFEGLTADRDALKQWYKRVLQVPMVRDGILFYHSNQAASGRLKIYSETYRYLPPAQFMAKFYPR